MNENWWEFSIQPDVRDDQVARKLGAPFEEVNPLRDGRQQLSYHSYLHLDEVLNAQVPSSRIVDERSFIITHQLFELAFKLCVFDLVVIGETLQTLMAMDDDEFRKRCIADEDGFWRPALTAAHRVAHTCSTITRQVLQYVDARAHCFDVTEFQAFRMHLLPASGFQSAQFRVIQHALGKAPALAVPLFPSADHAKAYRGEDRDDLVRVQDELVLGAPATSRMHARAETIDEVAHDVLKRLADLGYVAAAVGEIEMVPPSFVEEAIKRMEDLLDEHRSRLPEEQREQVRLVHVQRVAQFRNDLETARTAENARRQLLEGARGAATYLQRSANTSSLNVLLQMLVAADRGLHAEDSFLKDHLAVAAHTLQRLPPGQPSGTGGGGVRYLALTYRYLFPRFPVLVAYR